MLVHPVDHVAQAGNIFVIPQGTGGKRGGVGRRMDGAVLGADHTPTALCVDFTHGVDGVRALVAHTRTMRNLIKAVLRHNRSDLDRLEQDCITWVHHCR